MNKKENVSKTNFPIPLFIIGFIFFIAVSNYNLIPTSLLPILKAISTYSLLFAMTAIGLKISLQSIINKGFKVFVVGMIVFCIQIMLAIVLLS